MEQKDDSSPPGAPCPQAEALLAEYHDSVRAYREAVAGLDVDLPRQDFESSYRRAEEARANFEQRREDLLQHLYVHGCQSASKLPVRRSDDMNSADDFMNQLDAYLEMCLREHTPGVRAVEFNTRDRPARADLIRALERLIRETPREPADPERGQQNPGHH
jgi:hypothetical protein